MNIGRRREISCYRDDDLSSAKNTRDQFALGCRGHKDIEIEKNEASKLQSCDPKSWTEWFEGNTVSEDFMVEDDQPADQIRDDIEVQYDQCD